MDLLPQEDKPMSDGGMGKGATENIGPLCASNRERFVFVSNHKEGGWHGISAIPTYADQYKPCIEEDRGNGGIENAAYHLRRTPHVGKRGQRYEHPHRCHQ